MSAPYDYQSNRQKDDAAPAKDWVVPQQRKGY